MMKFRLVGMERVELSWPYGHKPLKPARLPIPPHPQN